MLGNRPYRLNWMAIASLHVQKQTKNSTVLTAHMHMPQISILRMNGTFFFLNRALNYIQKHSDTICAEDRKYITFEVRLLLPFLFVVARVLGPLAHPGARLFKLRASDPRRTASTRQEARIYTSKYNDRRVIRRVTTRRAVVNKPRIQWCIQGSGGGGSVRPLRASDPKRNEI